MSAVNRRRFFEESLIATALAVGAAAPTTSLVAEEVARAAASETLSHAVIGCRIRGKVHASSFGKLSGVKIGYVCDPDAQLAEELAGAVEQEHGYRPKIVQDMRRIFDDPSVDTVSIAAPNHWHALASIWAMQAGKDVYVEKPVSHNVSEGRRMVQVARKYGRICQAGTQNRSRGDLAAAAEYIAAGKLGEVSLIRSIVYGRRGSIGGPGTCDIPSNVDFDLWLGPASQLKPARPKLHYDWHWVWDTGNGELGNNNIHYVDICRWLAGLNGLGESVWSVGGRVGYRDAGETPNTQIVVHKFPATTIIQEVRGLKSDPFSQTFQAGHVLYGSQGIIAEGALFDLDGTLIRKFEGPGVNHFGNFIDCVRSRRAEELKADILQGHLSSGLCHVGNISFRLGAPQTTTDIKQQIDSTAMHPEVMRTFEKLLSHLKASDVDPSATPLTAGPLLHIDSASETFTNSSEANQLLTRSYRKPFVVPSEKEI